MIENVKGYNWQDQDKKKYQHSFENLLMVEIVVIWRLKIIGNYDAFYSNGIFTLKMRNNLDTFIAKIIPWSRKTQTIKTVLATKAYCEGRGPYNDLRMKLPPWSFMQIFMVMMRAVLRYVWISMLIKMMDELYLRRMTVRLLNKIRETSMMKEYNMSRADIITKWSRLLIVWSENYGNINWRENIHFKRCASLGIRQKAKLKNEKK